MSNAVLIDSYDPPGFPLRPDLASFSNWTLVLAGSLLGPCNRCHIGTILVHLLTFSVSFLRVVQAKKGACFNMETAVDDRAALATMVTANKRAFNGGTDSQYITRPRSRHVLYNIRRIPMEGSQALVAALGPWHLLVLVWPCSVGGTRYLSETKFGLTEPMLRAPLTLF